MQRYEISIQQPWNTHATEHGDWVKFTDAQAEIERLREIVENLHKVEKSNRDAANHEFHRAEKAERKLAELGVKP